MRGEFHIHTTYSDGGLSVDQILEYVKGKVDYLSITDHDILDGSIEAFNKSRQYDLNCIIGVEISSFYQGDTVHILGYFKNDKNLGELKKTLDAIREQRVKRLYLMKDKLKDIFNIDLDLSEILKISTITRGSIARAIIKQYSEYTMEYLFSEVIGNGCPAYIPSTKIDTQQAIDLIHQAGGVAVLAHPTLLRSCEAIDIIKMGVDGIEAIYPRNKENEEEKFRSLAKEHNLFVTAGSDFHYFGDKSHADLLTHFIYDEELEIFRQKVME